MELLKDSAERTDNLFAATGIRGKSVLSEIARRWRVDGHLKSIKRTTTPGDNDPVDLKRLEQVYPEPRDRKPFLDSKL